MVDVRSILCSLLDLAIVQTVANGLAWSECMTLRIEPVLWSYEHRPLPLSTCESFGA